MAVTTDTAAAIGAALREFKQRQDAQFEETARRLLSALPADATAAHPPKHDDKRQLLHDKVFKPRESLLSTMLKGADESYRAIYHAAIATFVWLGIKIVLEDVRQGTLIDLSLLSWAFNKSLSVALPAWLLLQVAAFSVLPLVAMLRSRPTWGTYRTVLLLYIPTQVFMYVYAGYTCLHHRLPPATGLIVACEAARLSMKMHAYLREKIVHGLRATVEADLQAAPARSPTAADAAARTSRGSSVASGVVSPPPAIGKPNSFLKAVQAFAEYLPPQAAQYGTSLESLRESHPRISIGGVNEEIGRYIYFCFAPTLIYRDQYPTHPGPINYTAAGVHAANLLGVIVYTFVLVRGLLAPLLTPVLPKHPIDIVLLVESVMVPSILIFLLFFYGVLHSWFNVFAEILRFEDRQFYSSWWTATNWAQYYRRWNLVVGTWLHSYVYNDLQRLDLGRGVAQAGVFILSAFIHEVILAFAFRFWFPVLLLMFGGPGVLFLRLTRKFAPRLSNVFLWLMLSLGLAMLCTLYSRELFARYGYEWADLVPPEKRGLPPYLYNPSLHPHGNWGWKEWASWYLVPRSALEFVKTYYPSVTSG